MWLSWTSVATQWCDFWGRDVTWGGRWYQLGGATVANSSWDCSIASWWFESFKPVLLSCLKSTPWGLETPANGWCSCYGDMPTLDFWWITHPWAPAVQTRLKRCWSIAILTFANAGHGSIFVFFFPLSLSLFLTQLPTRIDTFIFSYTTNIHKNHKIMFPQWFPSDFLLQRGTSWWPPGRACCAPWMGPLEPCCASAGRDTGVKSPWVFAGWWNNDS